ncbi:MAG: hypothetical protein Athens071416_637 [Parcubacteria group bacterium Athens0714_16]|nr:MAG: hypothetical protein Athens071416_637 [Parcubacteria group bacterium Athens0714_16]
MDEFFDQLTNPAMIDIYLKLWSYFKEIFWLLYKTKVTVFKTSLTGPISLNIGLFFLIFGLYWFKGRRNQIIKNLFRYKKILVAVFIMAKYALPLLK